MTLDTPTITQLVFGGLLSFMLWLLRDKVSGVQETLKVLTLHIETLKTADAQTDTKVALHESRLGELDRKYHGLQEAMDKHRSMLGDFLTKRLDDLKRDLEEQIRNKRRARG